MRKRSCNKITLSAHPVLANTFHGVSPDLWLRTRDPTEAWLWAVPVQRLQEPGESQDARPRPRCHRGGDHDEDSGYGDRDDPPHPVDTRTTVAPERGVDEPADQDPTDAADDGQPDRDVVPVARGDELAQQADDDAGEDDTDDLHCFLLKRDGVFGAKRVPYVGKRSRSVDNSITQRADALHP